MIIAYSYVCGCGSGPVLYHTLSTNIGADVHNPLCDCVNGPWSGDCGPPWIHNTGEEYEDESKAILAMVEASW